jgi:hypothetical protein
VQGWQYGLLLTILVAGCSERPIDPPSADQPAPTGKQFDKAKTGTVAGRITWDGFVPKVKPLISPPSPALPPPHEPTRQWPNPLRPLVESETRGVGDIVVFLRQVDLDRCRPWTHPRARIEQRDYQLSIHQGDTVSRVGFVRRGDAVEMVSRDAGSYLLQARGAAFFTLPFLDPARPCRRTLDRNGVVELTGAAGRFWMRGFLFVSEHPYFTRTDPDGDFALEQVPEGDYELVAWMPRWQAVRVEHDPSWNLASRVTFRPPLELTQHIKVRRGQTTQCDMLISASEAANEDSCVQWGHEKSSSP